LTFYLLLLHHHLCVKAFLKPPEAPILISGCKGTGFAASLNSATLVRLGAL